MTTHLHQDTDSSPAPLRRDDGSLLLITLVAVSVITLLSLSLGSWMRTQTLALKAGRYRREVRDGTHQAAIRCLSEHVLPDTNGWDTVHESWAAEPWEVREEGWVMRVSGTGWSEEPGTTSGLIDESGKMPLNTAPAPLLAALWREVAGVPHDVAEEYARRVVDWRDQDQIATGKSDFSEIAVYATREAPWMAPDRPFSCVAELARIPGLPPEQVAALIPYVTVNGDGKLNVNSASAPVLRAAFTSFAAYDQAAALRLMKRLLQHRNAGHAFTLATAKAIGQDLGGLPVDEAAILGQIEGFMTARSAAVSGVAEATPATAWSAGRRGGRAFFIWDRRQHQFTCWAEE